MAEDTVPSMPENTESTFPPRSQRPTGPMTSATSGAPRSSRRPPRPPPGTTEGTGFPPGMSRSSARMGMPQSTQDYPPPPQEMDDGTFNPFTSGTAPGPSARQRPSQPNSSGGLPPRGPRTRAPPREETSNVPTQPTTAPPPEESTKAHKAKHRHRSDFKHVEVEDYEDRPSTDFKAKWQGEASGRSLWFGLPSNYNGTEHRTPQGLSEDTDT
ncbi:hypothetical protein TREMEDRAFT_64831 [Tremella mesenterica DSM 1558]|uniref:uncharacterized protein n=1 Tax=Tremella mesenterica (strain ATCC 24925 / CBS 8224 / DSM 1558 / NBRC 9311 / NRRL Y-6157 / RJB 2259-6 / UBC 559-6) TaxID=578456 RepID=UPI0003F4A470|nr:uncharacterized protein TREMEDRAFT_64831 [Tremella mesenterica DSM 1558]EIW66971.1 hypothetical protein TREMEDRAFT_64831 [Tremella mesenterica DSM 1558]